MVKTLSLKTLREIDRKALFLSFIFSLFIIVFELELFDINYKNYIYFLTESNKKFLIFCTSNMLFALFCFFCFSYLSLISSWRFKIIYFLIFAFAVFHEYGYQNAFGRFSDTTDVNVTFVTTSEQKLSAIISYFNLIAIIPCISFLTVLFMVKPKKASYGLKGFIVVVILFVGFYSSVWYATPRFFLHQKFPTVSIGAFSRTGIGYLLSRAFSYQGNRDQVSQPSLPASYHPNNNIVLIIDESMRGDHFSLNGYSRPTTPYLGELLKKDLLYNWGIAVSASTCSLQSYDLIITGLKPDDLPNVNYKLEKAPAIFQYAKAMGYKTHFFDGQMTMFWGGITDDLNYIDSWKNAAEFTKNSDAAWEIDIEIAKTVKEITTSSSGNFILIFKHGNHHPYSSNFPPEAATWQPSYIGVARSVDQDQLPSLVNAYDNAIKFNVDSFFKNLASDYGNLPNNTVIIYTSDHSQTLGEDGSPHSHCGNTRKEVAVPLFIIGNIGSDIDTNFKAAHANLFSTMLDLMSYPESLRKQDYAISLLKAKAKDSTERYFFSLDLIKGEKIKFD